MKYSESEIIIALYKTLLLRAPDPEDLAVGADALRSGSLDISDVIGTILRSSEFSASHHNFVQEYLRNDLIRFTNDVSQYGEIQTLLTRLVNCAVRHKIVVDVGARGRIRSNSYDLMRQFGWRGLLIEANPHLLDSIEAEFTGLNFKLLNYAVSTKSGLGKFYIGENDDVSSLSEAIAGSWGPLTDQVEVTIERLPKILHSENIPTNFDVLSLDIEGEDVNVLNDLVTTSAFRPGWVIIELPHQSAMSFDGTLLSDEIRHLYEVVGYTESNLILELT